MQLLVPTPADYTLSHFTVWARHVVRPGGNPPPDYPYPDNDAVLRWYRAKRNSTADYRAFAEVDPTAEAVAGFFAEHGDPTSGLADVVIPGAGEPVTPVLARPRAYLLLDSSVLLAHHLAMRRAVALSDLLREYVTASTDRITITAPPGGKSRLLLELRGRAGGRKSGPAGLESLVTWRRVEGGCEVVVRDPFGGDGDPGTVVASPTVRPELFAHVLQRGDPVAPALLVVQQQVNEHLAGNITTRVVLDPKEPALRTEVLPLNYLGGLWLQFARSLRGEVLTAYCPACGSPFETSEDQGRRDAVYCSELCRMKGYRNRRDRAVELWVEGKQDAEWIALELGTDAETVRGWVKAAQKKGTGRPRGRPKKNDTG